MARERLTDVLLSSDPKGENDWSDVTRRACDVLLMDEGQSRWHVKVNSDRVGPGTVGWIHRRREGGRLAAVIMFTGQPYTDQEAAGPLIYCDGELRIFRASVSTEQVRSHPGWTDRAPYTTRRATQFRNGESLVEQQVEVLTDLLGPEDRAWLAQARRLVAVLP